MRVSNLYRPAHFPRGSRDFRDLPVCSVTVGLRDPLKRGFETRLPSGGRLSAREGRGRGRRREGRVPGRSTSAWQVLFEFVPVTRNR